MEKKRKRILLIITNGFAATNVIHSGLICPLSKQYEIHIYSDLLGKKEILDVNQHFGIEVKRVDAPIPHERSITKLIRRLEKAIFFYHFNIETEVIREKSRNYITNCLKRFLLRMGGLTHTNEWILKSLRAFLVKQSLESFLVSIIRSENFDGIISTSPLDMRENMIVNSFRNSIPAMALVISWDNLTTKGLINADHDQILVWNKFMKDEYHRFYHTLHLSPPKVYAAGIPRFDIYFQPDTAPPGAKQLMDSVKTHPGDKIVLFATSAHKHFPTQHEIVAHLIEYAEKTKGVKITVRCHPGDDPGFYVSEQQSPLVTFWRTERSQAGMDAYIPKLGDLPSLAEMLRHSDVCIHVASTMRLDAAACGKPIISIAYDGDAAKPYEHSVARFYDYTHQLPLNKLRIDKMIFSKSELFTNLDEVLFADSKSAKKPTPAIEEFIHFKSPSSIPFTVDLIRKWLD